MSAKDSVTYAAFNFGWTVVRRLPERRAYRMFEILSDRVWARRGGGVRQLEKNLKRVVPDATEEQLRMLSKQSMRNYSRYWCDAFRMPDWSQQRILDTVVCIGEENITDNLAMGKGLIAATGHMGNYDLLGAWGALTHAQVASVAERLEPEKLFKKFLGFRREMGMRIYPLGEVGVMDKLANDLLVDQVVVALLSDRDLTAHGIEVTFFGEKTRMPAGPANLALRTGSPLVAATLWYDGPKAVVKMNPRIPIPEGAPTGDDARHQPGYAEAVSAMTQAIANDLEEGIREHPTDWHMMQKLWLSDLDPDRLAAADAKAAAQALMAARSDSQGG